MTIDQVVALLASIGACLSAVATFLTVRQIAKQREASYRPELALSRILFEGSRGPIAEGAIPSFWTKKREYDGSQKELQRLTVPLQNVGLGTAKALSVTWSFPVTDVVARVNQLAQRSLTPAYFTFKNGVVSIKSDVLSECLSVWKNQQKDRIDYVLPAAIKNEPLNIELPHAYVFLCSALVFLGVKNKDAKSFPELPVLRVRFEYLDIGDRTHESVFDIALNITSVVGECESIDGYLEPKKAA